MRKIKVLEIAKKKISIVDCSREKFAFVIPSVTVDGDK